MHYPRLGTIDIDQFFHSQVTSAIPPQTPSVRQVVLGQKVKMLFIRFILFSSTYWET